MGQNEKALPAEKEGSIHRVLVCVVFVGVCTMWVPYYEMYVLPWVALKQVGSMGKTGEKRALDFKLKGVGLIPSCAP